MSDKSTIRARQACEPCRRKKTKCPGEKPVCSFCQRLGQRCSYDRGDAVSSRVRKPTRSASLEEHRPQDRVNRLESRVEEIFDILHGFTGRVQNQRSPSPPPVDQDIIAELSTLQRPAQKPTTKVYTPRPSFDETSYAEPPDDVWQDLIQVWKQRFDCQPLSLFSTSSVPKTASHWPRFLRYSFLSLTVRFGSTNAFLLSSREEAITFYESIARQEIFQKTAEGDVSLELLQSICLSALKNISDSKSVEAWTTIGLGVRSALAAGIMSNKHAKKFQSDHDARNRCCWSLFALDRMYGSTLTIPPALSTENMLPEFPISSPAPATNSNLSSQTPSVRDLGVMTYCLQLLSIWGETIEYVRLIKEGDPEDAWSPRSRYNSIRARVFEFETKFDQVHRFPQSQFEEYDLQSIEQYRSYWMPWLFMQCLFHAIQCLLNHPYLHIASRSKRKSFQPPAFLQNSVDQAIFHSAWTIKLIDHCTEKGLRIYDPFIGHLVAVTTTVYLFLFHAKDDELATQARYGLDTSYSFIRDMSKDWPHLKHTIEKLDVLRYVAGTDLSKEFPVSGPKAQTSLLWELFDYSASTKPSKVPDISTDAVDLNVDTRFLSNPALPSNGHTPGTSTQQPINQQQQNANTEITFEDANWDPALNSFEFNLFDNEQMADLANSTFARDLWSFGQL